MATSGRGTGMVGYNVQTAVEADNGIGPWQGLVWVTRSA